MFLRLSLRCAIVVALLGLVFTGATTAAISTSFAAGTLTITSDGPDDIEVGCFGGQVTVNGSVISGPVMCADVVTLIVNGGPGWNEIRLHGVTAADFTTLVGPVQVNAGAGNDGIYGSPFSDTILGGDGDDDLDGGQGGTDTLDGEAGGDTYYLQVDPALTQAVSANDSGADPADWDELQAFGSPGNDVMNVTDGGVTAGTQSIAFTGIESRNVNGDTGDDTLDASATTMGFDLQGAIGNDTVTGGSGDDSLTGDDYGGGPSGNDTVSGGAGNDSIQSSGGTDTLDGQSEGDYYNVDIQPTSMLTINDTGAAPPPPPCPSCGSPDDDYLFAYATSVANAITVTDTQMTLLAGTISYTGLESLNVWGRGGDDTIDASAVTAMRTQLVGQSGDDTLTGGALHNQLNGDDSAFFGFFCGGPCPIPPPAGDDVLAGGPGNDQLSTVGGTDTLDGQGGDDNYNVPLALPAADWVTNPANGHVYGLTQGGGSWADAEQEAVDWGGHLVTIDDAAEEAWVKSEFGSWPLIGLNDFAVEGTFVWSSGAPVVYTNFCAGEPNDLAPGEDAVVMQHELGDCWNDIPDSGGFQGVMELSSAPPAPVLNPTISDTGAAGTDWLSTSGSSGADAISVTNTQVTMGATVLTFSGMEGVGVSGDAGDDTIDASAATFNVNLSGQAGNDTLIGGAGSDWLYGDDYLFGCPFCAPPPPPGNDTLTGNGGNDNMIGNGGNDSYNGGAGSDWAQVQLSLPGASTVTDSGPPFPPCPPCGPGDSDSLNAVGTPGDDFIYGSGSSYSMTGFGSVLYDASIEWPAADGQEGNDTLDGTGALAPVRFNGNAGNDTLIGGDGNDFLRADDFNGVGCGGCAPEPPPGDDVSLGGGGNDQLFSRGGTDSLDGQDGSDRIEIRSGETGNATVSDSGPGTDDDEVGIWGGVGSDAIAVTNTTLAVGAQTASFSGMEIIAANGDSGDDTLNAATATSVVTLNGGAGNDVLTGGSGADSLQGDGCCGIGPFPPGNDILNGGAGGDFLSGDDGNDILDGGLGNDYFQGGLGVDTATYATRTVGVKVSGGSYGYANDGQPGEGDQVQMDVENVTGGLGADSLTGSSGANTLSGGLGNDTLDGGLGPDVLSGGAGIDSAVYSTRTVPVMVTMGGGGPDGEFAGIEGDDVQADIEKLFGGSGADVLTGSGLADTISGGGGSDIINGGLGNDSLLGNAGNDMLNGDDGTDTLDGGAGADTFGGGAGIDTATYALRSNPLTITVGAGANDGEAAEGDNVNGDIEKVFGGSAGDSITGGAGAETLYGNNGADTLGGGLGNDILYGGNGNDSLSGGGGTDTLDGQAGADAMTGDAGIDTATYTLRTAALTVTLDATANDGEAGEGDNVATEKVYGGSGNDTITGDALANTLYGYAGNDNLNGLAGNDVLDGGLGADVTDGDVGSDSVYYNTRTAAVFVTLDDLLANDGQAGENDLVLNMERVNSGSGNDSITGNGAVNYLYGGAGNDTITGLGALDYLYGQAGDDTIHASGDGSQDNLYCGTEVDGGDADNALDIVNADCEAVVLI